MRWACWQIYVFDRLENWKKPFLCRIVLAHTVAMGRPSLRIEVALKDQKEINRLLSGGVQQVRVVLRALALLHLGEGVSPPRISGMIRLTAQAVRNLGRRYQNGGLDAALYEKQRP